MKKKYLLIIFLSSLLFTQSTHGITYSSTTTSNHTTPSGDSVIERKMKTLGQISDNPLSIALYRPTYILPFYYTASPDVAIYQGNTPDQQEVMHAEFKAQLSLFMPVFQPLFGDQNSSIDIAYTQLNYWQVYASSQYFRETNYEPEIFFQSHFHRNWLGRIGFNHQSNGRGGNLERTWNRAILGLQVSGESWLISLKTWALIFQGSSSNVHNPDIARFLGHDNLLFSYLWHHTTLSLEVQNIESGLRRGFIQASISYPILNHISIYTQYFKGYGQSLIEYNHHTQSAGIGIAFNDWI